LQAVLEGQVSDTQMKIVPREWTRLAAEAPLPMDLLAAGMCADQSLGAKSPAGLIGPLLELRRAVWAPVRKKGYLRGLLLAGFRDPRGDTPCEALRQIAAELELALDLAEEERSARSRYADLSLTRRVLMNSAKASPEAVLAELAGSCTEKTPGGMGVGAVFAAFGECGAVGTVPNETAWAEVKFLWKSGDPAWLRAAESEPLASLSRSALDSGRVEGGLRHLLGGRGERTHVMAMRVSAGQIALGVLVVGLRPADASLAALDRLELRAALAAAPLQERVARREVQRRERAQQALLDACGFPALLVAPDASILAAGHAAAEFWGGEAAPIMQRHLAEIVRTPGSHHLQQWWQAARAKGGAHELDVTLANGARARLRVASGSAEFAVVAVEAAAVKPGPGEPRAEAELRAVAEWLDQGVLVFDTQERVRLVNSRLAQLLGIAPGELQTLTTLDSWIERLGAQTDAPTLFASRWRELARGEDGGSAEELHFTRPAPRVLDRAARTFSDASGVRLGRVEIYRDLTAQRLFQSRMLQTERLAALGQMVSGVAHELSNPLTSILGYAQRLLLAGDSAGGVPVAGIEDVRKILREAERAGAILRQTLLSARESPPERTTFALNRVVLSTLELQRFGLATEDIRTELDLDPSSPLVHGDAGQLQQVLINLIGNARQAIGPQRRDGRDGVVRIRTRAEGARVILEVADNGPGIPEAILARVFDPFFTTKPAGVGTGLGLAIVLALVRQHGGQVHVENPPGGGALFRIDLPAAAEPPERAEPKALLADGPGQGQVVATPSSPPQLRLNTGQPRPAREGRRVLVVEDEPTVAQLLRDVLADEGFAVDVLGEGRQALDHALRIDYDLVVCDMRMPGMDGQHFYSLLVQHGSPLRHRFLFVTGDVLAPQTHEFLERRGIPHVAKPFRVEELLERVRHVLGATAADAKTLAARKR
jgi:signal transduction histidine kinase/ActR/RegA family two-component response regulator